MPAQKFSAFTAKLPSNTEALYADLKAKHFLTDTAPQVPQVACRKIPTKKGFLEGSPNSICSFHCPL